MKNITVILPIHEWNDDYKLMFENSVKSVEEFYNDVKLIIVGPKKVTSNINIISDKIESKILINEGNTDFCSQINLGIDDCDTEWFSILEIDDEYRPSWLKFMNTYSKENPTVDVFLPIVRDINVEGDFLSFTNEATWAYGFSEKQGFLDNEALLDYQNFQISGALYKKSVIDEFGGIKPTIKLTFGYEFFLRLTYNSVKIMTIPKIGYKHTNMRTGGIFWNYKNGENVLTENEVKFWIESAKKEYFFTSERDIKYQPQEV